MTGISINKYICSLLKNDEDLTKLVNPNNIVSLYINPTTFPFISIMRTSVNPNYVKEGVLEDEVGVQVDIISDDYAKTIDIAEIVRDILECRVYKNDTDGVMIDNIRVSTISESYIENSYVQTLEFSIKIH